MTRCIIFGLLSVVAIAVSVTDTIGQDPPPKVGTSTPTFLPPVIIRPVDADVNRDGQVTTDDMKLLYEPNAEVSEKFIRLFYMKLLKLGKQYQPEWHAVETSRKNVNGLAVLMVSQILELQAEQKAGTTPAGAVCVLTYWAGERAAGWTVLDPEALQQIRIGKARFVINEYNKRWELVYNTTMPVWLTPHVD